MKRILFKNLLLVGMMAYSGALLAMHEATPAGHEEESFFLGTIGNDYNRVVTFEVGAPNKRSSRK